MRGRLVGAIAASAALVIGVGGPALGLPASRSSAPDPPVAVSMGDSYLSGEAGRWAGNTDGRYSTVDALGRTAYFDSPGRTAEVIPGCSRAAQSPIHFDDDVTPVNLACSGARVSSSWDGQLFKPGLDFYDDGKGHRGQAALLREVATGADVRLIVVSVGANDFRFADIVRQCVTDFALSTARAPNLCQDDASVRSYLRPAAESRVRRGIIGGLLNVRTAMRAAGHADGTYDVLVQLYPTPIPRGGDIRYPQAGLSRLTRGGCGFWNADADWVGTGKMSVFNRALADAAIQSRLTRIHVLDTTAAFTGHRLCERGVNRLDRAGLGDWRSAGAVDRLEWVAGIRTVSTLGSPYRLQEGVHPNYWGQRALAACIGLAWNGGQVRGGTCTPAGPGSSGGMPLMAFAP